MYVCTVLIVEPTCCYKTLKDWEVKANKMKKKQYPKDVLKLFERWKTKDGELDVLYDLREEYEKWRKQKWK